MHRTGSSKYLQLPAHDSSDIGKPSPLALLAATCQRIGSGSPSHSPKHRPRTPTPVLSRAEQPMRQSSPPAPVMPVVHAPIRSPVSPVERESTMPQPKACTSPAYELPLTPPSSPAQIENKASSPRITNMPVPVSIPNERLSYAGEHLCHLPLQPVLHMPSLHHYSPYTMVVPPSPIIAPYTGCVNQCCHAPHIPPVHPMYLSAGPLLPAAPISPPLSFGTYLHHDVEARMSSAGKMRSHFTVKSAGHPLYRPYDFTRHPRRSTGEEDFIDVVSV